MQFREGDRVSVEGVVRYTTEEFVSVRFIGGGGDIYTQMSELTLLYIAVNPGDEVAIKADTTHGKWTVKAVDGADAWVKDSAGNSHIERVVDLMRWVEAEHLAPPAADEADELPNDWTPEPVDNPF